MWKEKIANEVILQQTGFGPESNALGLMWSRLRQ